MKKDVKELLKRFTLSTGRIKKGDLVITAEIHRVTDRNWGRRHGLVRSEIEVTTEWPEKDSGPRIMTIGSGQQGVMKLK